MRKVRAKSIDNIFLSTPSARRATDTAAQAVQLAGNFYPRPPRGGRRAFLCAGQISPAISIHALREEGDLTIQQSASACF